MGPHSNFAGIVNQLKLTRKTLEFLSWLSISIRISNKVSLKRVVKASSMGTVVNS